MPGVAPLPGVTVVRRIVNRLRELTGASQSRTRVALACQGGGSHAAFTAGVLDRLLKELPPRYEVVGLSGASGGAVSATAAWYGLVSPDHTPGTILSGLWDDVAASSGWELWVNELTLLTARCADAVGGNGNPYANPGSEWGRRQLESTLTDHVDFDAFDRLAGDADSPALLVSAANVLTGEPATFRDAEITPDAVVASAAVPHLFEAVEIDGEYYWDGFLSQNPPLVELVLDEALRPVDELWIVRLSPKRAASLPTTGDAIDERSQQLVENLSLTRERRFIERVNEWVASGQLATDGVGETTVRSIDLYREQTERSRLDRRSSFIGDLYADGEAEASNFLTDLDAERDGE